jgi:hypothetical protein
VFCWIRPVATTLMGYGGSASPTFARGYTEIQMPIPWNIDELEIVGYANVLNDNMLPSVVPPVFRLKVDHSRALLPPYSFNAGYLCNATEVPQAELEALRDAREITLFESTFRAKPDSELWIDQASRWHYEPREEANKELSRTASEEIQQAEDALRRGDLQQAERHSGVAISANDKRVEPLAIKAAIRRLQENAAGERLMAELAAPVLEGRKFKLLVDDYCRCRSRIHSPEPPASRKLCSPMYKACARAA